MSPMNERWVKYTEYLRHGKLDSVQVVCVPTAGTDLLVQGLMFDTQKEDYVYGIGVKA